MTLRRVGRALGWARLQVGVRESPPGSRRGCRIDEWQQQFGIVGMPWCGAFVGCALGEAGIDVPAGIVSVATIHRWATNGEHGFWWTGWHAREPGDLVLFKFRDGDRVADHVGILDWDCEHTIEGNTTQGVAGTQEDGGTVARRCRHAGSIVGCARPRWTR